MPVHDCVMRVCEKISRTQNYDVAEGGKDDEFSQSKLDSLEGVGWMQDFKSEADTHDATAKNWRTYTLIAAGSLAALAALSIFIYKVP